MKSLLLVLAIPALLAPSAAPLPAQQARPTAAAVGAGIRIRVTGEYAKVAESGILPLDRQGLQATATVAGVVAGAARLARWSSSDESVVSIYGSPVGPSVMLVAQEPGRAEVTVTVGGRTASLPVVVGKARREIAAGELAPKFRVARLEVLAEPGNAGPSAEAVGGGGVRARENGHGARLTARAFAADGTPVPLEHFPVAWTAADEKVVELYQIDASSTQFTAREPGSTTVAATIQGVTATTNVEVLAGTDPLGPLEGSTVVARASGAAPAVATTAAASEAAATTTTSPTLRTVDSASRSVGIYTTAPTTTATTTSTTATSVTTTTGTDAPIARTAPTATRVSVIGAAPAGVGATASGGMTATVRWTPAPGATGHVVAWAASAAGPFTDVDTVPGTASSAVIARVPPGTAHFTVTATYSDRASGSSGPVAVAVPAGRQPTNFRATSAPGYVQLAWDPIPDAIGYTLARMDGGVATSLDVHVPAQARPLLYTPTFVDATGPGTTVGYVLSAVYRGLDGAEYGGDAATMPRTPATPLPLESGTNEGIKALASRIESNVLWVDYVTANAAGWVSTIAIEKLGPTGWTQVTGHTFSWKSTDARYRAVPGARTDRIWLDPNIPGGCDHTYVFRLRVVRSVGGDTAPQQQIAEERSRPFSVTADNPTWGCHRSTP